MCGIYGTTVSYNQAILKEKMKLISFRGPDFSKIEKYNLQNGGELILGHNRLSIIDLDSRSNQPFEYLDKISIVFNGEIYNYKSIKEDLVNHGFIFATSSDTEVLAAAFLKWGEDCLKKLRGMFAFVIYDRVNNILFGARDRMGEKPLYYSNTIRGFEFSSQLAPIQLANNELSISKDSISSYLSWGNIPDPNSIFNEVSKLEPGHFFKYSFLTKNLAVKRYWDLNNLSTNSYKGSFLEAKSLMSNTISDCVKNCLFTDVPTGVFLSGGIDSSLIASIASRYSNSRLNTFSIAFNESEFDESKYASSVANYLGTNHTTIDCSVNEGLDLIENFSNFFDEPFADASAIPSMLLSKHTSKHVKVALTGDGGDESFLGYSRYRSFVKGKNVFELPHSLRKYLSKLINLSPNYRHKVIAKGLALKTIEDFYIFSMSGLDTEWISSSISVISDKYLKYLHTDFSLEQRMGDFDLKTYLSWDINTKVDRASMSSSIETRAPLLDHKIIELARSLPVDFKIKGSNQKRILKEILYDYVPEKYFDRPKSGFTMPFKNWFRLELKDYVMDNLNSKSLKEIPCINPLKVEKMISQHMDGSWNHYPVIWKLLVLKQWINKNATGLSIK